MKILSSHSHTSFDNTHYHEHQNILTTFKDWIKDQEPTWEYYRFGIGATGIFIQVSIAGLMVAVLGMAGASPWVYGIGIFFAFFVNSMVFAQSSMRLILELIILSSIINLLLILFYGLPMLLN